MRRFLLAALSLTVLAVSTYAGGIFGCGGGGSSIVSINSLDGATGVSTESIFEYTFSRAVNTGTVTPTSYTIAEALDQNANVAKAAYDSSACNKENAIAASVSCSSATACQLHPTAALASSRRHVICLALDIQYDDGSAFEGFMATFTTADDGPLVIDPLDATSVRQAILSANPNGILPKKTFTAITLPEFPHSGQGSIVYSLSGLPDGLSFDATARTISLDTGETFPAVATSEYTIVYTATGDDGSSQSVELVLNDSDDDEIYDYLEYRRSAVPLLSSKFGWIWLNADNEDLYRPKLNGQYSIPTGLIVPTKGMNLLDPDDASLDYDGDGVTNKEELLTGTNPFVYTGTVSFANYTIVADSDGAGGGWTAVAADVNNDGCLDIVSGRSTADNKCIRIYNGNCNGTFDNAASYATLREPGDLSVADINGDGYLDVISGNQDVDFISVFINSGTGTYPTRTDYATPPLTTNKTQGINTFDLYGDGTMEILMSYYDGGTGKESISVYRSSTERIDYPIVTSDGNVGEMTPLGIDINGNNMLDVVVPALAAGKLISLDNVGGGELSSPRELSAVGWAFGMLALDYNNDDAIDLASSYGALFINDGTGVFSSETKYTPSWQWYKMGVCDLNGNGLIDIAVAEMTTPADVALYMNNGDGTFAVKTAYDFGGAGVTAPIFFDADNDGDIDMLVLIGHKLAYFENLTNS